MASIKKEIVNISTLDGSIKETIDLYSYIVMVRFNFPIIEMNDDVKNKLTLFIGERDYSTVFITEYNHEIDEEPEIESTLLYGEKEILYRYGSIDPLDEEAIKYSFIRYIKVYTTGW